MFRTALIVLLLGLTGCASTYHERYRYYADSSYGDYYYEPAPRSSGWIGIRTGYGAGYYDPFWSLGFHTGYPGWYPRYGWGYAGWYGSSWGYWGRYHPWWSGYPYWHRHIAWHGHRDRNRGPRRDLRGRSWHPGSAGTQRSARSVPESRAARSGAALAPQRRQPASRAPVPRSDGRIRSSPEPTPARTRDQRWQRPELRSDAGEPRTTSLPSRSYVPRSGPSAAQRAPVLPTTGRTPLRPDTVSRPRGALFERRAAEVRPASVPARTTPAAAPHPNTRSQSPLPSARPSSRSSGGDLRPMRSDPGSGRGSRPSRDRLR